MADRTTEELRTEILRILDRGGRYEKRDSALAALRACAPQSEVLLDLWDDETDAQRRLHDFGRRLDIAALAFKTDMDEDDFHAFMKLVHEHHRGALSLAASEQAARLASHGEKGLEFTLNVLREEWEKRHLGREIRQLKVVGAAILPHEELVDDDRRLPRSVRIALSRLAKDSWMATRLGDRLVLDIAAPLGTGDYLWKLVANLDLIGREDLRKDMVTIMWSAHRGHAELLDLMRKALAEDILIVDEMPTEVQAILAAERKAEWCRDKPGEFVAALDAMGDSDAYADNIRVYLSALPDLVRTNGVDEIERLARVVKRHREEDPDAPGRATMLETVLVGLEAVALATPLVGMFTSGAADVRTAMGTLFEAMGPPAWPLLLRVLSETDRRAVCVDAALQLEQLTTPNWLVEQLTQHKPRPRAARYLLKILGAVGGVQHAIALKAWLRHGDEDVRDAAIEAAFKLGAERSLPVLLRAVYDPESSIVIRALHFLERLDYRDGRYLRHLFKLVKGQAGGDEAAREAPEAVRVAAIETMTRLGDFSIPDPGSFEELLLGLLPEPHRWSLTNWHPPEPTTIKRIRLAAVEALGTIGGEAALEIRENPSGETDETVKAKMERAAGTIRRTRRAG